MNQQLTERIQQAIASTPEGKPRLKALKAIQWRLKSPAGYATFSGVGEASEALVFSGCDNETLKARYAFRRKGHDAWSCDLLPADSDPEFHHCGDVRDIIGDGWDMMIAHPPCDYLTVSGNRWFSDKAKAAPGVLTGQARRDAQQQAVEFVRLLWEAPIPRVAIENPIGRLSTLWQKPSQVIQPFHFGDPFRKGTCLWLRGLPPLKPTSDLTDGEQACWLMPPSKDREKFRSITYSGIAQAMADQWTQ